ncbi:MAG: hypothetical protein IQL11_05815 [Bacteroidales bacterium]|nr:hypothetical protein [Bacteroidales bacterium]
MKIPGKILLFTVVFVVTGHICFAQNVIQQRDTSQIITQINQSAGEANGQDVKGNDSRGQVTKGNADNQVGNQAKNNPGKTVKQVKGARPDMSKARGARPPSIVRPSGSGIPKGIGKPGGVGKRPGR